MADYYPLLARAIAGLPVDSPENRQTVYDRARRALLTQLRSVDPPLPESDIERERSSLDVAIRRIESERAETDDPFAGFAHAEPAAPARPRMFDQLPERPAPRPFSERVRQESANPAAPPSASPSAAPVARPAPAPAAAEEPVAPSSPPVKGGRIPLWTRGAGGTAPKPAADEGGDETRPAVPVPPVAERREASTTSPAPEPVVAPPTPTAAPADAAPSVRAPAAAEVEEPTPASVGRMRLNSLLRRAAESERSEPMPDPIAAAREADGLPDLRADRGGYTADPIFADPADAAPLADERPAEEGGVDGVPAPRTEPTDWDVTDPTEPVVRERRWGRLVTVVVMLAVLGGAVAVGFSEREKLIGLIGDFSTGTTPPAKETASGPAPDASAANSAKSTDRVAQSPGAAEPQPVAQPQAATPASAPAPSPVTSPPATPVPGAPAPAGALNAQRAVMFEENPGGGQQGLQQFVGTVTWKTETFDAGNGNGPDLGIHATVEIPDRQVKVEISLRRNQDSSLPASHIIELHFDLPQDFDLGTVANVPGIRAKPSEGAQGVPLAGLAVRVTPGFFLVGLSALEADRQRNLALLITRNWLDVPLVFSNGRRGILALEKGPTGDSAFREAFGAWGLPVPQQRAPAQ
ncbi:hypothetical protein MWN34_15800 [Ancylobacter sp. 6x-1]|uniref:Histidine kinase n=1 Tax=Ancylobacter crimeensis TaxID=2579147 RepID=A0ABT0DF29_9HYPH|nr:hypothetical protein [Ancylobacter crimeensis]MCK0198377.1 hypothetical protein [Ancylobacter crimeensis]